MQLGLLGRIIDNWLTNANERQYQIPFCQLLAREGETIIYISPHGQLEKGKDVISQIGPTVKTYQMKGGDIGLTEWRDIYGEIVNLVELPVEHPSIGLVVDHEPFLVTNGDIKDSVLEQIRVANVGWKARGFKHALKTITKGQLLSRFEELHGAFLPKEPADFRLFLELLQRPGTYPLEKKDFARLLKDILPFAGARLTNLNLQRALGSAVLLTSYLAQSPDTQQNYWALAELWTMAASYVLCLAEKWQIKAEFWKPSFDLCSLGAERALESLCKECEGRKHFLEGEGITDALFYASRMTILVGALSGLSLRKKLSNMSFAEDYVGSFVREHLRECTAWGESAVPFLMMAAIRMQHSCVPYKPEATARELISHITFLNNPDAAGQGFPDPYFSAEECFRMAYRLDMTVENKFVGFSYMLEPLIDYLARRWCRRSLKLMWFSITRISLLGFQPSQAWEWFEWTSENGTLNNHFAAEPASWQTLLNDAEGLSVEKSLRS
jgi:hypothetical protein